MASKRKSDKQKSRNPKSSRARNRRLARQNSSHRFEALEDRRLLASVTVGNSLDLVDGDTSSIAALISSPGADGISLREAITASNNTNGPDTITFDSTVFTGGTDSLIRLTGGELEITDSLTIDGSAATDLTITGDANGDDVTNALNITDVAASFGGYAGASDDLLDDNSRVLNFSGSTGDLTLSEITVSGGRTTGANQYGSNVPANYSGGGIRFVSNGQLTVAGSTVSGNSTAGLRADGGGIFSDAGSLTLTNSEINENLTIGSDASGGGIFTNSGSVNLTNTQVTGNSTAGSLANGGGIYSQYAPVILTDSTVSGNSTTGYTSNGGGVATEDGSLTLIGSTVSENFTVNDTADGGGIYTRTGAVNLTNSTISKNSTEGRGADGGGISTFSGSVNLTNSTVSENFTTGDFADGGGIETFSGQLALTNSTVSGNRTFGAEADGGGIVLVFGSATLTNSTITENVAADEGGGVFAPDSDFSLTFTIANSILAGNLQNGTVDNGGTPNDLATDPDSVLTINHSLIGVADNITQTIVGNIGNQFGTIADPVDPLLGPLVFNGGLTRTHALLPGSPAIDAGFNALAVNEDGSPLLSDQRANGADRIVSDIVDLGAFEFDSNAVPNAPVVSSTTRDEGGVLARPDLLTTYSVSFDADVNVERDDLTIVNESFGGVTVDLSSVAFSYDVTTQTATWDFSSLTLDPSFYSFELSETIFSATGGVGLDGDGDTTPGGTFVESVYVALPGDANLDGQVDVLGDAFPLLLNLGISSGATWAQGDFNGDGVVNVLGDAFILVSHLGQSAFLPTTVNVVNSSDLVDGDTTSTVTLINSPGADGISLREAIIASNNTPGADTITFASSVFTGGIDSLIRLTNGELEITETLTIDASTATDVTISGDANADDIIGPTSITDVAASFGGITGTSDDLLDDNSRVLNFSSVTGDLTLSGIAVSGGRTVGGNQVSQSALARYNGGGIRFVSNGLLSLTDSEVSGNSTAGMFAEGGGIFVDQGSLTLDNSTIAGNSTAGVSSEGGGIYSRSGDLTLTSTIVSGNSTTGFISGGAGIFSRDGSVNLSNSTVSGNSTKGVSAFGGGISVTFGTLTLSNSTVNENSTLGDGASAGGILAPVGDVFLTNSTVSGNSTLGSSADGGGIALGRGSLTVTNSTVSGNSSGGLGGGVFTFDDSPNRLIAIENSIIADNLQDLALDANGNPNDLVPFADDTLTINHSLIGVADNITQTINGNVGNLFGTEDNPLDPMLGPLADNGGPTQTHALLSASPAIDAGNATEPFDQRGFVRVVDQQFVENALTSNGSDIGAFEFQGEILVVTTSDDELDIGDTELNTFDSSDLSLREAIAITNSLPGSDGIIFDQAVFTGGTDSLIRLTGGELEITDTLTIDGSAASDLTITGDANGDDVTNALNITDVAASFVDTAGAADDLLDDNSRVLNFASSTGDLTLSNITVTGGRTTADNQILLTPTLVFENTHSGGGIRFLSDGQLTLTSTVVSGNSTAGFLARGGGIYSNLGAITLNNSTVGGNSTAGEGAAGGGISTYSGDFNLVDTTVDENSTTGAHSSGGGIYSGFGTGTFNNSTVSGNSISGFSANGGGVYLQGGSLALIDSTVNGNSSIGSAGGGIDATDASVTLTNSMVNGNSSAFVGGGIRTRSSILTLTSSTVSENSTNGVSADGGGVYADTGLVTLTDSTISGNSSTGSGGGIFRSRGPLTLTNSMVSENSVTGLFADGGGISINYSYFTLTNSTVTGNSSAGQFTSGGGISASLRSDVTSTNSTISGNSTTGNGGGITTFDSNLTLANSTVSGNSSMDNGGGIRAGSGTLTLNNSTVSGNSSMRNGGGITLSFSDLTIENSIVAGNLENYTSDTNNAFNDLDLGFNRSVTINHSLIGVADNITQPINGNVGNLFGTTASPLDPLLAPLADNGGPTQTHALLPGSPAIDAGSNALAVDATGSPLLNDQRGTDFDRIVSGIVDLGAFEFDPNATAQSLELPAQQQTVLIDDYDTATFDAVDNEDQNRRLPTTSNQPSLAGSQAIDSAFEAGDLFQDGLF